MQMLSVRRVGRYSSPYSHFLERLGFDLKLESSWEISGDERNRWPMEVWKDTCASLLAWPNIRSSDVKEPVSVKDSREPGWRKTVGMKASSSPNLRGSSYPFRARGNSRNKCGTLEPAWENKVLTEDTGVHSPWMVCGREAHSRRMSRHLVLYGPS